MENFLAMRKLFAVASLLLFGLAEAATIKLKFTFATGDLTNFVYSELDGMTDGQLDAACDPTGSVDGTISAATALADANAGQYVILTCSGISDENAAQLKLASLVPELADAIVKFANNAKCTNCPNLLKIQLVLDAQSKSKYFPESKEVSLTMAYICGELEDILDGLATTLNIKKKTSGVYVNIELKEVVSGSTSGACPTPVGRRLLSNGGRHLTSSQMELRFELPGLSTYQLDVVNGQLGSGDFSAQLVNDMAANGAEVSGPSAQLTNGGGGTLTDVTQVKIYEAESSVNNMHNFARLQGGNDFLGAMTAGGDKQTGYFMGAGLIAVPCILCLVYTMGCYCCHIGCCKCCLNNKKPYSKKFPPVLIASAVFLLFFFVGWALFMKSASSFTDMKDYFVGSGKKFLNIIDTAGGVFTRISEDGAAITTALTDHTKYPLSCEAIHNLDTELTLENPLAGLGSSLSMAESGIDGYDQYNIVLSMLLIVLPGLYFAMGIGEALSTWLLLKNSSKFKCCHCLAKCGCCCSPCALISMWFGAFFCVLLAAVFGDFCAKDPLVAFISAVDLEAELGYLLTCKGTAPDELVDAYEMAAALAGVMDNIDGLKPAITATASCSGVSGANVDVITDLVKSQGDAIFDMIGSITCYNLNEVINGFLSDGICHGLQPGVYFAWLGCFFCSVSWMFLTFFWVRVSHTNQKSNKVGSYAAKPPGPPGSTQMTAS